MLCCLHTTHAAIKPSPFLGVERAHAHSHCRTKSFVPSTPSFSHCFFCLCHRRAPSSLSPRATSTWPSTTSRCCTMASWPAPSPSPTTPRRRMPSCAWSPRRGKTPPSSSTRHTRSCYRSVWLYSSTAAVYHCPTSRPLSRRPHPGNSYMNNHLIIRLVPHRLTCAP